MPTNEASLALPDTYFDLVRHFPLVSIKDDAHLDRASAMLNEVLQRDDAADPGVEAYLDALTDLVETYETARFPAPDVPPRELLAFLMSQHELTQERLAEAADIPQSTISAILSGQRRMTAEHMTSLAGCFGLSGRVFMRR